MGDDLGTLLKIVEFFYQLAVVEGCLMGLVFDSLEALI